MLLPRKEFSGRGQHKAGRPTLSGWDGIHYLGRIFWEGQHEAWRPIVYKQKLHYLGKAFWKGSAWRRKALGWEFLYLGRISSEGAKWSTKTYSVKAGIAFPEKSILESGTMKQKGPLCMSGNCITVPGKNVLKRGPMKHKGLLCKSRNSKTWEELSRRRQHESVGQTLSGWYYYLGRMFWKGAAWSRSQTSSWDRACSISRQKRTAFPNSL